MSGPEDARETTDEATGESPAAESASLKLPAFGLEAPWWAAESAGTARPADEPPREPEFLSAPVMEDEADAIAPVSDLLAEAEAELEAEPEGEAGEVVPVVTLPPPGTLVAGKGVPSVDSRRAVPAEPIVQRPLSTDDTDPDGFQPIPAADEAAQEDDPAGDAPDKTVVDDPVAAEAVEDAPTPLSAFEKARQAEDAASTLAPVLVPDAILPPGVVPPTGSGPFPQTEQAPDDTAVDGQPPVITPIYHAEGGVPVDTPPPPGRPRQDGPGHGANKSRVVLIGGGAALVLAAAAALFLIGETGSGNEAGDRKAAEPPAVSQSTPAATPSPTSRPVDINNEKSDPADLGFHDVFPAATLQLGGRTYTRDRWSLNRDVAYAARGSMLTALQREKCRKIVRATYIDPESKLAVTSGIAVMPTKAAAIAVSKAGDPAQYEWFRGMAGKRSPDIDRAGGYAAATVRGRYVAYAYVQWANGRRAKPGDPVTKKAAQLFLDYDLRPIVARARG
ncbi:hypothetical protein [Spirillospora sp. CA-128828]|uniref:hypothetical protein n=1 Tax=Spirillospora sp. CA-128828 TaxID=3240033 RepID=UPI003D919236